MFMLNQISIMQPLKKGWLTPSCIVTVSVTVSVTKMPKIGYIINFVLSLTMS